MGTGLVSSRQTQPRGVTMMVAASRRESPRRVSLTCTMQGSPCLQTRISHCSVSPIAFRRSHDSQRSPSAWRIARSPGRSWLNGIGTNARSRISELVEAGVGRGVFTIENPSQRVYRVHPRTPNAANHRQWQGHSENGVCSAEGGVARDRVSRPAANGIRQTQSSPRRGRGSRPAEGAGDGASG